MTREEVAERSRAALGADGVAVMAAALRCTSARFKSPAPVVVAVIELIDAALAAGIAREQLPPRWHGLPSRKRCDLRARFESLFAPRRPVRVLRSALGLTPDVINRRLVAHAETRQAAEFLAIVELLEAIHLTPDYIGRAFRGETDSHGRRARPSGALCAVIELLETLEAECIPRDRWPDRWQRPKRRRHIAAADLTAAIHAAE